jgi:hypothetical protein
MKPFWALPHMLTLSPILLPTTYNLLHRHITLFVLHDSPFIRCFCSILFLFYLMLIISHSLFWQIRPIQFFGDPLFIILIQVLWELILWSYPGLHQSAKLIPLATVITSWWDIWAILGQWEPGSDFCYIVRVRCSPFLTGNKPLVSVMHLIPSRSECILRQDKTKQKTRKSNLEIQRKDYIPLLRGISSRNARLV